MAKIDRKNFKMFGKDANTSEIAQIGSFRAGTPLKTKDIDQIQALPNYLDGWFGIAVGENSPAMEDMNAIQYLFAYMIAYLYQQGVPEWNIQTEYHLGSLVNQDGQIYYSLVNNNTGNALSDGTKWAQKNGLSVKDVVAQDTYSVLYSDEYLRVNAVGSTINQTVVTLPSLASVPLGRKLVIKNTSDLLSSGSVRVAVNNAGTETIDFGLTQIDLGSGPPVNESITLVKGSATNWDVI